VQAIRELRFDCSAAERELGWKAAPASLPAVPAAKNSDVALSS
jgi:hypothetical protein